MKKDNDYSVFLLFIAMWLMVCALAQCESAIELSNIRNELILMRYK